MSIMRTTFVFAAGLLLGCGESPGKTGPLGDDAVVIASPDEVGAAGAPGDAGAASEGAADVVAEEHADASRPSADAGSSERASSDGGAVVANDGGAVTAPDAAVLPDASTAGDLAALFLEKRKLCHVFDEKADPITYAVADAFDTCIAQCWIAASCGEVRASFCTDTETAFWRCLTACDDHPADGFRCGDGKLIAHADVCNTVDDCSDSADEHDCGSYLCADGTVVPSSHLRCDLVFDCADRSDELGCTFTCAER
jgi:hypothetical protein